MKPYKRGEKVKLYGILIIMLILVSYSFALTSISTCTNLSTQDEIYQITADFTANQTGCLTVNASGIIIDGQNHIITSTSNFYHFVNASSGLGYTAQNIILNNYTSGFEYSAPSNFTNISMVNTTRIWHVARGGIPTNAGILTLLNTGETGGVADIPVNVSNILYDNITIDAPLPAIGIFAMGTRIGGRSFNLSNSQFNNISMQNITLIDYQGSGNGLSVSMTGIIAMSGNGFTSTVGNFSNIIVNNFTLENFNQSGGNGQAFGVFTAGGTVSEAASDFLNYSNINISNVNFINCTNDIGTTSSFGVYSFASFLGAVNVQIDNTIIHNMLVNNTNSLGKNGIFSYVRNNGGFGVAPTIFNITNSKIIYNFNGNQNFINVFDMDTNAVNLTTDILNLSTNITYSSGQNSISTIGTYYVTNTSQLNYTLNDIPLIPLNTNGATSSVNSYLNLTSSNLNSSTSITMYYIPIIGESTIALWNYSTSWNLINNGGVLDTINNNFLLNLSNSGVNGVFGLFSNTPFSVSLNAPSNNRYFNVSSVIFNWTTSGELDSYFSNLTIDGVSNVTDIPTANNTLTPQTVNGFADGLHNWSVTSYNSSVSNSSTTQFFTIDTIPPSIALNSPANATYTNNTLVNFNFTQTDVLSPTSNCSLFIDNVLNSTNATTDNSTATISPVTMSEGNHNWYISCTDLAGNTNVSEIRTVIIDTISPIVSLNNPINGSLFNITSISFNFTQTDTLSPNSNCSIYINGILNTTNTSTNNATSTLFTINGFADNNYNWSVDCADLAGNINTSEIREFSVGTIPPSITLISPTNSFTTTSASNAYMFNATSGLNSTFNCSLLIESLPVSTQTITNASNSSIIYAFSSQGSYHWAISCIDSYGNSNISSTRIITYQIGGGGSGFVTPPSPPPVIPPPPTPGPTTLPGGITEVIKDIQKPNGGTETIIGKILAKDNPNLLGLISPSGTIERTSALNVILSELQGLEALYFNIPIFNLLNFGYIFILFIGVVIYFLINQKKKGIGNIVLLLSAFVFLGIVIVTVALNEAVLWFGLRVLGK